MNTSRMQNEPNGRKDSEKTDARQDAPYGFHNEGDFEPLAARFAKHGGNDLQEPIHYADSALESLVGLSVAIESGSLDEAAVAAVGAKMRQIKEAVKGIEDYDLGSDLISEAKSMKMDFTKVLPPPDVLLEIGGEMVLTRGNFICVTGQKKSRKSFLTAMFAARLLKEGKRVMLIDTEQDEWHVQLQGKRILAAAGLDPNEDSENFTQYCWKTLGTDKRRKAADALMREGTCDVAIIDGIRDMIRSINDEGEAQDTTDWLMNVAETRKIGIVVVLHQNKSNDNVRGHIGTEVMNKAETTIKVTRNQNNPSVSDVDPESCRNKEFEGFSFTIDDERTAKDGKRYGIPKLTDRAVQTEEEKWCEIFRKAFKTKVTMRFTELETYLMGLLNVSKSTAKRRINEATEGSVNKNGDKECKLDPAPLVKDDEGLYRLNPKAKPVDVEDDVEPL